MNVYMDVYMDVLSLSICWWVWQCSVHCWCVLTQMTRLYWRNLVSSNEVCVCDFAAEEGVGYSLILIRLSILGVDLGSTTPVNRVPFCRGRKQAL